MISRHTVGRSSLIVNWLLCICSTVYSGRMLPCVKRSCCMHAKNIDKILAQHPRWSHFWWHSFLPKWHVYLVTLRMTTLRIHQDCRKRITDLGYLHVPPRATLYHLLTCKLDVIVQDYGLLNDASWLLWSWAVLDCRRVRPIRVSTRSKLLILKF